MASGHTAVADDVAALAGSLPTSFDGGEGTPPILRGLASLADALGQLETVDRSAAERLRTMVDVTRGVDAAAEQEFRRLDAGLR